MTSAEYRSHRLLSLINNPWSKI